MHAPLDTAPLASAQPSTLPPRLRPRRRLWVHRDVLEWLQAPETAPQLVKRARLLLWQFFALGTPPQVKSVRGVGAGWLRSDLGGNHGHQYYLWWAPQGARPLAEAGHALGPNEAVVRAVRHHDDTDHALDPDGPEAWTELTARDLVGDYALGLEPAQEAVLRATARVRLVRGQPGTGKTTVLLESLRAAQHGRALYLTYNPALVARAEGYLREFAAAPESVRVDDFGSLLQRLEEALGLPPVSCAPPSEIAGRFRAAVQASGLRLGPWESHLDALYAELHAHFFGAALPEAFRDMPACIEGAPTPEVYEAHRQGTLGKRAAEVAAQVGRKLWEQGLAGDLVPGPWRARRLYDRLRATPDLPEAVLPGVEAVYVDEVQDLTLLEAALLIEVTARRGASLLAAGDEGQTVRPTDFDWGAFADLVSRRFAEAPLRLDLPSNLRSPQALALVLRRADALYTRIDKQQRPRGGHADAADDVVMGRVLRCRSALPDARARLLDALRARASTVAVSPASGGASDGVVRCEAVKGLDYNTAVVLGAAGHLAALKTLASGPDPLHAVLARGMIDGLRVCLSRASDTLVLFDADADADAAGVAMVDALCDDEGEVAEGCPPPVDLDALLDALSRDEGPAEETVVKLMDDIRATLLDSPAEALARARRACSLLGRANARTGVRDERLRAEARRLHGVAATALGLSDAAEPHARRALFDEAHRALQAAGCDDAARGVKRLRDVVTRPEEADRDAVTLAEELDKLVVQMLEAERPVVDALRTWVTHRWAGPLPEKAAAVVACVDAVASVAASLASTAPELMTRVPSLRRRAAEALLDAAEPRLALRVIVQCADPPAGTLARCHEALGAWAEALRHYEAAGDRAGALRCHRALGHLDAALAHRDAATPAERAALEWLQPTLELLEAGKAHCATLTETERKTLGAAMDALVPARRARRG